MNGSSHPEAADRRFPRCPECGGKVQLTAKKGRTREFVWEVHLPIPDTFEIPTCVDCGEESMAPEIAAELDKLLGDSLAEDCDDECALKVWITATRDEPPPACDCGGINDAFARLYGGVIE